MAVTTGWQPRSCAPNRRGGARSTGSSTSPSTRSACEFAGISFAEENRDVIGRAKGILMARAGVSDEEAFAMLTAASQRMNLKLRDIAKGVAEQAPEPPT